MKTPATTPAAALSALVTGIRLGLGDPRLRRKLMASLVVNALAFLALVALLLWGAFSLVDWMVSGDAPPDPGWLMSAWLWLREGVGWLLRVAAAVGTAFIAPVLYNLAGSLLMPMFHGPVFNAARRAAAGPPVPGAPDGFAATGRVVAIEVRRLVRFVLLSLAILPINLVPGFGSLAYMAGQLYLSSSTLGWDLLSYHFELHDLSYAQQRAWVAGHRPLVLTLGAAATALCMIPVVQLVFITTNVAGAGVLSAWMDGAPRSARPPAP